jgi:hypothetical protein
MLSQKHILDIDNDLNLYQFYNNELMLQELCNVFKNDKYTKQNSILVKVCFYFSLIIYNI